MTDSPYIKTYNLKQHTPMIHFQHSEAGATLRASEAKPKLDRFLIEQCKRNNTAIPKEWYLNPAEKDSKPALKYKMQIIAPNEAPSKSAPHSLYFGNTGKEDSEDHKQIIFKNSDDPKIRITCFEDDLLNEIDRHIKGFFLTHNFGARQTKGFGSFFIAENNGKPNYLPMDILKEYVPSFIYVNTSQIKIEPNKQNCIMGDTGEIPDAQMDLVKILWNLLKGGINYSSYIKGSKKIVKQKKAYQKSYLIRRFASNNIGSEKAFIKSSGILKRRPIPLDGEVKRKVEPKKYSEYKYLRALLGLTESYKFIDTNIDDTIKVVCADVDTDGKPKIQRFASPVMIKILPDYIVFLPSDIPEELYGAKFIFTSKRTKKSVPLNVPEKSQFNLSQFLLDFAKDFNESRKSGDQLEAELHRDFSTVSKITIQTYGGDTK